ncbi:hypothetical protein niasHT_015071 [Heterodera trifolii]|uniref:CCHC-type domain-containing protein n=1 Tax=Heterodera trifolii TaxID=157864 RepID=A0ABD2L9P0_9BILA
MENLERSLNHTRLTRQRAQNEGLLLDRDGNVFFRENPPNRTLGVMNQNVVVADPNLENSEQLDSFEMRRRLLDPNNDSAIGQSRQNGRAGLAENFNGEANEGFVQNRTCLTQNLGERAGPGQQFFRNFGMRHSQNDDDFFSHPNMRRTSTPVNENRGVGVGPQNFNEIGFLAEQIGRVIVGQLNSAHQNPNTNPAPNLTQHGVEIHQQIHHSAVFARQANNIPVRVPVQQNPAAVQQNFGRPQIQQIPPSNFQPRQPYALPMNEQCVQMQQPPMPQMNYQPPPTFNTHQNQPNFGMGNFDFGIVLERIPDLSGTEGSDGIKKFFKKFDFYSLNWSDAQKIRALESKLYGRAERAFQTAQSTQPFRYESIKREMLNLLEETDARNLNAFDELMQGVKRGPNESIDELANRISGLVQRAYNGLPQHLSNEYAIKFLVRAMGNPELALNLELVRTPGMTLDHFVSLAARAESTQKATQRFSRPDNRERSWRTNTPQHFSQTNNGPSRSNFEERGQQIQRFGTQPNRSWSCFNCNSPGHLARDCPQGKIFRPIERTNYSTTMNQHGQQQTGGNRQQMPEPNENPPNRHYQQKNYLKQNCLVLQEEQIHQNDFIVGELKQDLEEFFDEIRKCATEDKKSNFSKVGKVMAVLVEVFGTKTKAMLDGGAQISVIEAKFLTL